MRTWGISTNRYHKQVRVYLIDSPWYALAAEWLGDKLDWGWMYKIDLPNWPSRRWRGIKDGEKYTPYEWYGSLGLWWYSKVSEKLYLWSYKVTDKGTITLPLSWDDGKELFSHLDTDGLMFSDNEEGD